MYASNIAVHTELSVYPVYFKSYSLMFKYNKRLCKIECDTDLVLSKEILILLLKEIQGTFEVQISQK
jgi:hypothetical protein